MSVIRKILVVDDDPIVGKSFDRVLTSKGYAVITAISGEEALLKLNNEHYDVVFTDIKMPGMSGLEVAERVKASQPWLPVVIVTGYGTGANEERAEAAGVSGFLRKPLSPEMIEASTEKALQDLAVAVAPVVAAVPVAIEVVPAIEMGTGKTETIKNIALFLAAPMIGLAYVVAMPFVGIAMLVWFGSKALLKRN
ncbi:MAG: response regulator [Proteobacteria bacterium]|nr:response regulator [Pseudomonadota bacterium]